MVMQRVRSACVRVADEEVGRIATGLLVFLGVAPGDGEDDASWLQRKLLGMRIFPDTQGRFAHAVGDVAGGILLISQFTLFADCRKGNRPSFTDAAPPEVAQERYEYFCRSLTAAYRDGPVAAGIFAADMQIEAHNDGPVTIVLDSADRHRSRSG